MVNSTPGKHERNGITLVEVFEMFSTETKAGKWFFKTRWGTNKGVHCPRCGSFDIDLKQKHPTMPYRCLSKGCKKYFSLKTGTLMQSSKFSYRQWAIAIYLMTTEIKGKSSMKLHRDLGITQKHAWHMVHRIRESYTAMVEDLFKDEKFSGIVEVDETFVGGKFLKMNNKQRKAWRRVTGGGQGSSGKEVVTGIKSRGTNKVKVQHISGIDKEILQDFVIANTEEGSTIITDEARGYIGINKRNREHFAVNHSAKKFVDGMAHNNGMESFWSLFKRGIDGTYHSVSPKHLTRYAMEFAGRHNDRQEDTIEQMGLLASGMVGKKLRYSGLIADNGKHSGVNGRSNHLMKG